MKYKNKKTGVVIDTKSELAGDWEPVKKAKKEAETPAADGEETEESEA